MAFHAAAMAQFETCRHVPLTARYRRDLTRVLFQRPDPRRT
jgi:hypothetical protein